MTAVFPRVGLAVFILVIAAIAAVAIATAICCCCFLHCCCKSYLRTSGSQMQTSSTASMVSPMIPTLSDTPVATIVVAPALRSMGSRLVPWKGEIP